MRLPVPARIAAMILAWVLLGPPALGQQPDQPLRAGGLEIFYGLIPAEIVLGHPANHSERSMHGGVPAWGEQFHLLVTLFEQRSRRRIQDAEIEVTVFHTGRSGKRLPGTHKRLEPMLFASAASYGNYFNLPSPGSYRIELEIRRQGAGQTVRVPIEYRDTRIATKPPP